MKFHITTNCSVYPEVFYSILYNVFSKFKFFFHFCNHHNLIKKKRNKRYIPGGKHLNFNTLEDTE